MNDTSKQFDNVIEKCKEIFDAKLRDYGAAWRILRTSSITDQIYIKANRIRNIQIVGNQEIGDSIPSEFIGIVNYSIIALIQLEKGFCDNIDNDIKEIKRCYERFAKNAKDLMMRKNHDYGEAWRNMRISSLDDIILMKLMRVKQIEDNQGVTEVSEGLDANYYDIINYAVFALIQLL